MKYECDASEKGDLDPFYELGVADVAAGFPFVLGSMVISTSS